MFSVPEVFLRQVEADRNGTLATAIHILMARNCEREDRWESHLGPRAWWEFLLVRLGRW